MFFDRILGPLDPLGPLGQDPYGEFFVVADASVPLEDLWNRHWADFERWRSEVSMPVEIHNDYT